MINQFWHTYKNHILKALFFTLSLLLPSQLGTYNFESFSYINGIRVDYLALKFYLTDIIAISLIIISLFRIVEFVKRHLGFLAFVVVLLIVNISLSSHPIVGLYTFLKYTEVACLMLVFYLHPIYFKTIVFGLLTGSVFELGVAVAQMKTEGSLQGIFYYAGERYFTSATPGIAKVVFDGSEHLRPYGTFSHPNSLGGFYLIVYSLVLFQTTTRLTKSIGFFSHVLLMVSSLLILVSFSINAIIGWVIITSIFLYKYLKSSCNLCRFGRFLIVVSLSGLFLSGFHSPTAWTERIELFKQGALLLLKHPIFGVGAGQHLYHLEHLVSKSPYISLQPIHNIILIAAVEWGLVIFFVIAIKTISVLKTEKMPILIIFGALMWVGIFDHYTFTLQQNMFLGVIVIGILLNKTSPRKKV